VIAIQPATYGESIEMHTSIVEWRNKTFTQRHVVKRSDTVVCEGTEVRAFCIKDPDQSGRIKAIPVPAFIREASS